VENFPLAYLSNVGETPPKKCTQFTPIRWQP
jgi:hypothetical protein